MPVVLKPEVWPQRQQEQIDLLFDGEVDQLHEGSAWCVGYFIALLAGARSRPSKGAIQVNVSCMRKSHAATIYTLDFRYKRACCQYQRFTLHDSLALEPSMRRDVDCG